MPGGEFKSNGYTFRMQMTSQLYESVEGAEGAYVDFAYDDTKQASICLRVDDPSSYLMAFAIDHEGFFRSNLGEFSEFIAGLQTA